VTWGVSEVMKVVVLFFLAAISLNLFLALVRLAVPYRLDSTFFGDAAVEEFIQQKSVDCSQGEYAFK
jgi:hypothetical protein